MHSFKSGSLHSAWAFGLGCIDKFSPSSCCLCFGPIGACNSFTKVMSSVVVETLKTQMQRIYNEDMQFQDAMKFFIICERILEVSGGQGTSMPCSSWNLDHVWEHDNRICKGVHNDLARVLDMPKEGGSTEMVRKKGPNLTLPPWVVSFVSCVFVYSLRSIINVVPLVQADP
jgi:hypothetical protein